MDIELGLREYPDDALVSCELLDAAVPEECEQDAMCTSGQGLEAACQKHQDRLTRTTRCPRMARRTSGWKLRPSEPPTAAGPHGGATSGVACAATNPMGPESRHAHAATTVIRATFLDRGFLRITISTSWSNAFSRVIRRSTEKPLSL